jgi:hypothetical protein
MIIVQCPIWSSTNIRGLLLKRKLLNQGFLLAKLKLSLRKFYGGHHDLTAVEYLRHKWPRICSTCRKHFFRSFPRSWLITGFVTRLTPMGATSGAGTAYPSGAPQFTPVVSAVRVTRYLVLYVCFVDHCFSFCTFSFVLSVLLRYTDYSFGILRFFLSKSYPIVL